MKKEKNITCKGKAGKAGRIKKVVYIILLSTMGILIGSGATVYLLFHSLVSKMNLIVSEDIRDDKHLKQVSHEQVYSDENDEKMSNKIFDEITLPKYYQSPNYSSVSIRLPVEESNQSTKSPEEHAVTDESTTEDKEILALDQKIKDNLKQIIEIPKDNNITNIIVLAIDSEEEDDESLKHILLLTLDKKTKSVIASSFALNIYLSIPGQKNSCLRDAYYYGGADLLREAIEVNFKLDISQYVKVDLNSCKDLADDIGFNKSMKLDLIKLNDALNTILPEVYTDFTETELFMLLFSYQSYMDYKKEYLSIPKKDTYTMELMGDQIVLGIDFEENIQLLYEKIYQINR